MAFIENKLKHKRTRPIRLGGVFTVELLLTLPVLLIVVLAVVQFSMMLIATQAVGAAASVGVREAVLPGATAASVTTAVTGALAGFVFAGDETTTVYVNGMPAAPTTAVTGDEVTVSVKVAATKAAPNALSYIGISIASTDIQQTYVMRKE